MGSKETEVITVGGWVRGEKAVGKGSEKEGDILGTREHFCQEELSFTFQGMIREWIDADLV